MCKHYRSLFYGIFTILALAVFSSSAKALETLQGRPYWSAKELAQHLGMTHQWASKNKEVSLSSLWSSLTFTVHQRNALINEKKCVLAFPVILWKGDLYVSDSDVAKTIRPLLIPKSIADRRKLYRIVLDPGHGGNDSGAVSSTHELAEKTLTLKMAQQLCKKLQALGYDVHLTRKGHEYVSLRQRAEFANHLKADLFISIHCNAASDSRAKGIESFVFTPQDQPSSGRNLISSDSQLAPGNKNDEWNLLSAFALQDALLDATGATDRGLKRARFEVLKHLQVPGVLVELGFLSNAEEAQLLGDAQYQNKLMDALVQGVLRYQRILNDIRREE